MKRAIIALLAVASLALVALPMSPYNILKTKENFDKLKEAQASYAEAKRSLALAEQSLLASQNTFTSGRTFEVHYGDITRLNQLLNGIAGLSVTSITGCDATNYFASTATWSPDDVSTPTGIKVSLTTEDVASTLRILNKMELPLYQISVTEPNLVDAIFLTGEAIG